MKAVRLRIHNFRSLKELDVELKPYGLLVGANNAGKSNVLAALRVFYEDNLKFAHERDFPRFPASDNESWIEIAFRPEPDEFAALEDEYKSADGTFSVRKYLASTEADDEGKPRAGLYGIVDGAVSKSKFYGAKNIQQAKLGKVIYIPAVSKIDDQTKMTGASPLRDLITNVLKTVLGGSDAYVSLRSAFEQFSENVKTEKAPDGSSLEALEAEISQTLADWGARFELKVNSIDPENIIKNLIEPSVVDPVSGAMAPDQYGHGMQRHLAYSLLMLAGSTTRSAPASTKASKKPKKEFSPDFTWLLFEEPEAFLHPTQADVLDRGLRRHAEISENQVLVTTHGTRFVSRNMMELPALVRLERRQGVSLVGQLTATKLKDVLEGNQVGAEKIRSGSEAPGPGDDEVEMESIKYALWLDPSRTAAFFAARVFLVEGPTERAVFDYLADKGDLKIPDGGVMFLDTFGKWNTHRFIGLLSGLRIPHVVLHDLDGGKEWAKKCAQAIEACKTEHTLAIETFDDDFETFLEIAAPARPANKPQSAMWHIQSGRVKPAALDRLRQKVQGLIDRFPVTSKLGAAST